MEELLFRHGDGLQARYLLRSFCCSALVCLLLMLLLLGFLQFYPVVPSSRFAMPFQDDTASTDGYARHALLPGSKMIYLNSSKLKLNQENLATYVKFRPDDANVNDFMKENEKSDHTSRILEGCILEVDVFISDVRLVPRAITVDHARSTQYINLLRCSDLVPKGGWTLGWNFVSVVVTKDMQTTQSADILKTSPAAAAGVTPNLITVLGYRGLQYKSIQGEVNTFFKLRRLVLKKLHVPSECLISSPYLHALLPNADRLNLFAFLSVAMQDATKADSFSATVDATQGGDPPVGTLFFAPNAGSYLSYDVSRGEGHMNLGKEFVIEAVVKPRVESARPHGATRRSIVTKRYGGTVEFDLGLSNHKVDFARGLFHGNHPDKASLVMGMYSGSANGFNIPESDYTHIMAVVKEKPQAHTHMTQEWQNGGGMTDVTHTTPGVETEVSLFVNGTMVADSHYWKSDQQMTQMGWSVGQGGYHGSLGPVNLGGSDKGQQFNGEIGGVKIFNMHGQNHKNVALEAYKAFAASVTRPSDATCTCDNEQGLAICPQSRCRARLAGSNVVFQMPKDFNRKDLKLAARDEAFKVEPTGPHLAWTTNYFGRKAGVTAHGSNGCPAGCSADKGRGVCIAGHCKCFSFFSGPDCAVASCPNSCNGGKCLQGKCACNAGFYGSTCQFTACKTGCEIHGVCDQGTCKCDPNYTGETCQVGVCPNECMGKGDCVNGRCKCMAGWTGVDCANSVCKDNCNGNGDCDPKSTKCACNKDFIGESCNIRTWRASNKLLPSALFSLVSFPLTPPRPAALGPKTKCPYDCFQNGECDDRSHICSCKPSHVAPYCKEKRCPADCSGHGTCNTVVGLCTCDKFYMAEADCSRKGTDFGCPTCPIPCSDAITLFSFFFPQTIALTTVAAVTTAIATLAMACAFANLALVDLAVAKTFALLSPCPTSVAVDSTANAQWRVATASLALAARIVARTFSFL